MFRIMLNNLTESNMWLLVIFFLTVIFIYKFITNRYEFWKQRGVPNPPVSLLFGNFGDTIFLKKSIGQLFEGFYKEYPNLKYIGFYKFREPALLIRDAELVKNVLIKDFSSFHDNDIYIDEKVDPIFGRNPFALKGDKWKITRNQLTPCFTSGRLKAMFPLVSEVGKRLVKYLNESNESETEAKELSLKYTTDVVASCLFGMEGNSFVNGKAELLGIGKKIFTPSIVTSIKHVVVLLTPILANFLDFKFFPDEVANYFRIVIGKSLKYREENNIVRGDFLDNMKDLRTKLGGDIFSNEDIICHAGGLFSDGFETSSIAMSFILFELAANIEAQNTLRQHLDDLLAKNKGEFTYEDIIGLPYLHGVFKESLRLHPPATFLAKVCTKDFKLPSPFYGDDTSFVEIKQGMPLYISAYGMHHDPKHYNDPEKFIPERHFDEIERPFLTFGSGPRYCLGEKFGVMQVKTGVAYVISNFEICLSEKTILPLEMDPQFFMLRVKKGLWLNFNRRK